MIASFLLVFIIVISTVGVSVYAQQSDKLIAEYCEYKKSIDPNFECPAIPDRETTQAAKEYLAQNPPTFSNTPSSTSQSSNDSFSTINFEDVVIPIGISVIVIIIIIAAVAKSRGGEPVLTPELEKALNNNFRNYDPRRFEELVSDVWSRNGFKAELTPKGPDQGVDVFAKQGKEKVVIQAKCWQNKVSNGDVLKTLGAMRTFGANRAVVITNSDFTKNAKELLRFNSDLRLINMEELRNIIKKTYRKRN